MKYYIIAGEASGDLHGSNLMKGLYHEDPEADIRFWGGDLMNDVYKAHQSGTGLVQDYKDGAIIGFVQVLLKAKQGIYLREQIEPLPDAWKRRYFKNLNGEQYQICKELRQKIVFRTFNLMDDIPFRGRFHIVFLRNVMIYFDENTKRKLLDRIYDHMAEGGYLFIGTTESIDKAATRFQYIRPSIYKKKKKGGQGE